ncbi:hypothetical protein ACFX12_030647 [Malus domestica]
MSIEAIVHSSSALERVRESFSVFENALRADNDLKAAMAVQDTLCSKIDALKAKGEALADLDRQMAKLLKMDKKNRQAEVIMGEVRWLELKALIGTLLPSLP